MKPPPPATWPEKVALEKVPISVVADVMVHGDAEQRSFAFKPRASVQVFVMVPFPVAISIP